MNTLNLTEEETQTLKQAAQDHGMTVEKFLFQLAKTYLELNQNGKMTAATTLASMAAKRNVERYGEIDETT